jgi:hypothetical protein
MTSNLYSKYPLVDTTVGTRLLLGFIVPAAALQQRLPHPWQLSSLPASYLSALGLNAQRLPELPNLQLVFNDYLLNQDAQGRTQTNASERNVAFSISATNPNTGEEGMIHVRSFTGNPHAVPGPYCDALPAQVRRDSHVVGEGTSSRVGEHFQLDPEAGGTIDLQLTYERGPLLRMVGDRPAFPEWAAADTRIQRIHQEESLLEVILLDALGINRVQMLKFQMTVPELADLFDGSERLVSIIGNPQYARKIFSPKIEPAANA